MNLANLGILDVGFALAAGSLTTLSPCVFPILPLVVGGASSRHRYAPVAMGAGMVAAFALIGLVLGTVGAALGIDADVLRTVGAVLLIAFGVVMLTPRLNERLSSLMSPLANRASASTAQVSNDSLFGAFALGGMLGLVWSPCSGPLLASALSLVASKGGALTGTLMLAVFGLGAAIPLVAIAYASKAGFNRSKGWVLTHIDRIKTVFGVLIIALGIAILLGYDKVLEAYLVNLMPDVWVDLTTRF
jgi:cytochrome c-type biogenesis protein